MIAVLGLGSIGLRHARTLLDLGQTVVGFDPNPERRALLEQMGGQTGQDRQAVLDQAQAAIIASPSGLHLSDMQAGLAARCHLFVEKPLSHSLEGMELLLDQAESKGMVIFAAFNLRYHPVVQAARKIIGQGELGALLWGRFEMADYLPNWRPGFDHTRGYANDPRTGGVIFDIVHEFDLAAHLMGPPQVKACQAAHTGTIGLAAEDMADMVLCHANGALSSIHVDFVTRPRRRESRITGSLGSLTLDLDARRLVLTAWDGTVAQDTCFAGSYADDYRAEMADFLACIQGRSTPACDGREAAHILEQLIKARSLAGLPA